MLGCSVVLACLALLAQANQQACPNMGKEAEFPMKDLKAEFNASMKKVVDSDSGYSDFFANHAMTCQMECVGHALDLAMLTLFQAGINDNEQGVKAITGAIKTCFPMLPRDDVMHFVKQIGDDMPEYNVPTSRLYNAGSALHFGSSGGVQIGMSLPMMSFCVAAVAASFFLGRHVEKSRSIAPDAGLLEAGPAE